MKFFRTLLVLVLVAVVAFAGWQVWKQYNQVKVLNKVIERLSSDSRIAEVLVTDVNAQPGQVPKTTIKFLEYDSAGKALKPKYFTFTGNIIQFQSLVIRFDDKFVKYGDALRGKSAYLFLKAFSLKGRDTEEYEINKVNEVPAGYEAAGSNEYEKSLWREFWQYALGQGSNGVKNAQIEAPGTRFEKGIVYTIKIEHDGGMRIDASKVPQVLQGEKL